ncbi:NfeD family protein [Peptoniphilaceae bacterium SGI.131]
MLTGLLSNEIIFLFVMTIAIIAIIIEVFVPSFGLIGLAGIYFLIESFFAMKYIPNLYTYLTISIVLALIISFLLLKFLLASSRSHKLILKNTIAKKSGMDVKNQLTNLLGLEAKVVKTLRPAGQIKVGERVYDAISYGEYIEAGENIVVDKIEGSTIYCKRI